MRRWITDGTPPPIQPLIEIAGSPPAVLRDENGNAKGGVRVPDIEVPIARHEGGLWTADGFGGAGLSGRTEPFTAEKLQSLYGNQDEYVRRVEAAAKAAVCSGILLPHDAEACVARAKATTVLI